MSYIIFMRLSLVVYSFHALALYISRHIMMLPRLVIPLTIVLFLPIIFFLVVPSLLGRVRSMYQFLVQVQRLSCVICLL
jgi:hypothetical protein